MCSLDVNVWLKSGMGESAWEALRHLPETSDVDLGHAEIRWSVSEEVHQSGASCNIWNCYCQGQLDFFGSILIFFETICSTWVSI